MKVSQKEIIITETTAQEEASVFFCSTCKVTLMDSAAYIDHMNGKNHYKALGMSMVVERVTLERVKARLAGLKRRKEERKKP